MRVNPVPLLFAPGVALAGYVADGAQGLAIGLGGWLVVVAGATCWAFVRYQRMKHHPTPDEDFGGG